MDTKKIEYAQTQKRLQDLGVALESLYKANTGKEEREQKKLEKKLKTLETNLEVSSNSLLGLKEELNKIEPIQISGMNDQTRENPEVLSSLLAEKIQKGIKNSEDISKITKYQKLFANNSKIIEEIRKINKSITDVKQKISVKEQEKEVSKKKFAEDWTTSINEFCSKGKKRVQKIKVFFAGDKITLKTTGDEKESVYLVDLVKLNKIVNLVNTKTKYEELKDSKDATLVTTAANLRELEKSLREDLETIDKKEINSEIERYSTIVLEANIAKRKAVKVENYVGNKYDVDHPIMRAILNEKNNQEKLYDGAIKEINRLHNILIDSARNIDEKKTEIIKANKALNSLKEELKKDESKLDKTTTALFAKLSDILGQEDITIEEGIESLEGLLENTPFGLNLKKQQ